jgi:hypothetical protein
MNKSFNMARAFLEIGDELYEILRRVNETHDPIIDTWKEHLRAEKVFRKDGYLYFCTKIEDAVVIEETVYPKEEL